MRNLLHNRKEHLQNDQKISSTPERRSSDLLDPRQQQNQREAWKALKRHTETRERRNAGKRNW
jgi:hypothetical protein